MPEAKILPRIKRRIENTPRRHEIIRKKFNEYYAMKIEGMHLDYDSIIKRVAEDFGYSQRTIINILKGD